MKQKTIKTCLFLGTLLTLSVSMDMIYGVRNNVENDATNKSDGLEVLTLEKDIQLLLPLLASHSVEKLVDGLRQTSPDRVYAILKKLLPDTRLTSDEQVQTIFGIALFYPDNKDQQFKILDLIIENKELSTGNSLAYVAAQSSYPEILPRLLEWADKQLVKAPLQTQLVLNNMAQRSLRDAVKNNDLESLQILHATGVFISPERATDLLWVAINSMASPKIVEFIIKQGAQINNERSGSTPLIKAVTLNNFPIVELLMQAGADASIVVHDEIGSALQQAIVKGFTDIELYLRNQGVRE